MDQILSDNKTWPWILEQDVKLKFGDKFIFNNEVCVFVMFRNEINDDTICLTAKNSRFRQSLLPKEIAQLPPLCQSMLLTHDFRYMFRSTLENCKKL